MTIYVILLISVLNQAGFSGSRVAVSLYALELGANPLSVGVIIAFYSLCPMLFSIAIGRIVDRTAPRLPIIAGAAGMVLALLLPLLFSGLGPLYVMALLLGLFHGVFNIPLEAIVGGVDGKEKRARNYAVITMGWSAANTLGPLAAGFSIDYFGHVQVFWVLAAINAAPVLILMLMPGAIPKTAAHGGADAPRSVLDLWRLPPLRMTIIAGSVIGSAQDLFQFYMPIYGHAIGLSASAIGAVLGMLALAAFMIRGVLPYLVRKLTEGQVLISAACIAIVAFVLFPLFVNPYALAATAFLLGLGVGCTAPMTLSLLYALTPEGRIAEALGIHKTLRNATQLAVPVVFGSVGATFGYSAVFLANAAMLAVSSFFLHKAGLPASDDLRRTRNQRGVKGEEQ